MLNNFYDDEELERMSDEEYYLKEAECYFAHAKDVLRYLSYYTYINDKGGTRVSEVDFKPKQMDENIKWAFHGCNIANDYLDKYKQERLEELSDEDMADIEEMKARIEKWREVFRFEAKVRGIQLYHNGKSNDD